MVPEQQRADSAARLVVAAVSLALGGLLLFLSAPRIVAEFLKLPGNRVLAMLQKGTTPSERDLAIFITSRERSLTWADSGRSRTDLALAQLLLAERETGGARSDELVEQAAQSMRAGLSLAPANPYAWTRMSFAALSAGVSSERVAPLVEMSIRTGPSEPDLIFTRLGLCLVEWPYFGPSSHPLLEEQVRLAWRQSPDRLAILARAAGRADTVRSALPQSERAEFDRHLEKRD
jgi:hypothetical protein